MLFVADRSAGFFEVSIAFIRRDDSVEGDMEIAKGGIEVEVKSIDRKYERYRMRSAGRERMLLTSILTGGIEEPLAGVFTPAAVPVLLDGFKRLRCAEKLNLNAVPFISLGEDEAVGILQVLRISNHGSLSLLEQAKWVDELRTVYGLSVVEIASRLDRS